MEADGTMRKEKKRFQNLDVYIEKIKEKLVLPEKFLSSCTLKEGTFIVVTVLQGVAVIFSAFVLTTLLVYKDATDEWWHQRFKDDYDPYINGEYKKEIVDKYYPYWWHLSIALIGVHGVYFLTGFCVYYALYKKEAHPAWYLPWIIWTGFMVSTNYFVVLALVVVTGIISTFRDITVTWDMVPTILVFLYALAWSYGFFVVVAHYKRRVIVRWWKNHDRMTNADIFNEK